MTEHGIETILRLMPHRYPFLLVDRVVKVDLEAENGATIKAYKNVTINEEFFNGHFPKHPVMPGVLTLEAMAQAAGLLAKFMQGDNLNLNIIYYFAGADNVRFKRLVVPGDQLFLEARFISRRCGISKFECRAYIGDDVVCTADLTCAERELEPT